MKLKNKDLVRIAQGLEHLSTQQTAAWYAVNKNKRKVQVHMEEFEQSRRDVMEKMAERNEDGSIKTKVVEGVEVLDVTNPDLAHEIELALNNVANEEIEIEFYTSPISMIVNETHSSQYIDPLIDTIFIES